jgi:hypothetical protein
MQAGKDAEAQRWMRVAEQLEREKQQLRKDLEHHCKAAKLAIAARQTIRDEKSNLGLELASLKAESAELRRLLAKSQEECQALHATNEVQVLEVKRLEQECARLDHEYFVLKAKWAGWEVHLEGELEKYVQNVCMTATRCYLKRGPTFVSCRAAEVLERGMTVEREAEMDTLQTNVNEQRARIKFLERRVWVSWVQGHRLSIRLSGHV